MTASQQLLDEFDAWTPEDDQRALAQIATQSTVKHIIKNGKYLARTPDNQIFELPLALSFKDFEALSTVADTSGQVDQLKRILTAFAGSKQAKELERQPVQVLMNLLADYGKCVAESQGADLGK